MSCAGPSLSHPQCSAAGAESHRGILSSDRHAGLLLAQMNKMRLQSDFCDVRLLVGGRVFGVHKLVLAASGPYFAALFSGAMSEAHEEEVRIVGVEADVFEILLEFIYTGMHVFGCTINQISNRDYN
uniref:BTB domain-containing protein n=1 Tax=Cyprinus carpio TaxID=7962 RepID=A0A8C2FKS2_CYPCA